MYLETLHKGKKDRPTYVRWLAKLVNGFLIELITRYLWSIIITVGLPELGSGCNQDAIKDNDHLIGNSCCLGGKPARHGSGVVVVGRWLKIVRLFVSVFLSVCVLDLRIRSIFTTLCGRGLAFLPGRPWKCLWQQQRRAGSRHLGGRDAQHGRKLNKIFKSFHFFLMKNKSNVVDSYRTRVGRSCSSR